ncbi:hypothetical protein [Streptomyces anulatus]|uniref:hypothetical protein n=1 Tax=Streptomyces anulatus TaxID=1892 RepID=UPI0036650E40
MFLDDMAVDDFASITASIMLLVGVIAMPSPTVFSTNTTSGNFLDVDDLPGQGRVDLYHPRSGTPPGRCASNDCQGGSMRQDRGGR